MKVVMSWKISVLKMAVKVARRDHGLRGVPSLALGSILPPRKTEVMIILRSKRSMHYVGERFKCMIEFKLTAKSWVA